MDKRVNNIEGTLKSIVDQSYKIFKASTEHVKILISQLEGNSGEKGIIIVAKDQGVVTDNKEGTGRRTKANTRKMTIGASSDIRQTKEVYEKKDKNKLLEVALEDVKTKIKELVDESFLTS